ncbi:MAG: hypothetical protein CVV51_01895 [Spirochaetae bacterium HGW-Spirochaetae-7]|jgi:hypothetical protein|nr:MAG: hypothetical protein CVV51_01895 [Spirochaetae bacterium HGW-Spirochaetae-7]
MPNDELNTLVARKKRGEDGLEERILDRIARDVYRSPRLYGFRTEDEVGEVFERYWHRIAGLVDRYEDTGANFEAFLVSTLRYMALSVRRKQAWNSDREAVFVEESKAEIDRSFDSLPSMKSLSGTSPELAGFPAASDTGVCAVAFRRRVLFLCVKCANMMDDEEAATIARNVGLDENHVVEAMRRAREIGLGQRRRSVSRRRGRDAAWLRYETACRRLSRETDLPVRQALERSIERDRGLYRRAVALMARSKPSISNKAVAELLCIPKGTVDCGVGRILRQCAALYARSLSR